VRRRRQSSAEPIVSPGEPETAPDGSGGLDPALTGRLAEIDRRVQRVASDRPEGSDLNTVASAIHDLVECIRELHRSG